MDQGPLVIEQIEAGARLVRDFHSYMAVEVAFWIKTAEGYRWTLCIASDQINEKTWDLGYGEALRLIQEMNNPYLDLFRIRLVNSTSPLARAALEERRKFPGSPVGIRLGEQWFGDTAIEGAYIYPESTIAEKEGVSAP